MKIIVQAHGTNVYHREEQKVHDYVKDFIPLGLSQLKKKTDLIEVNDHALDVDVLSSGKTALIEMNDAFAVSAYGDIPADIYTEWLFSRWNSLMA